MDEYYYDRVAGPLGTTRYAVYRYADQSLVSVHRFLRQARALVRQRVRQTRLLSPKNAPPGRGRARPGPGQSKRSKGKVRASATRTSRAARAGKAARADMHTDTADGARRYAVVDKRGCRECGRHPKTLYVYRLPGNLNFRHPVKRSDLAFCNRKCHDEYWR